ncbi:MAG: peptidoglycan-binding domain-containing protein [Candidatus Paceibacterota bacterium]
MKSNITRFMKVSGGIFAGAGLAFTLAFVVGVPQARAESNILVSNNLTVGSTGQNVVVLQGILSELGYMNIPFNIPFGYFGPATRDALARYQASQGVSPAVGYFGSVTKIAMHQQFSSRGWLTLLGW